MMKSIVKYMLLTCCLGLLVAPDTVAQDSTSVDAAVQEIPFVWTLQDCINWA